MTNNRKARRESARRQPRAARMTRMGASSAVIAGGMLLNPLVPSYAIVPSPVVTACGYSGANTLGAAIAAVNSVEGVPGTVPQVTFNLASPCVINIPAGSPYVISENISIVGPGSAGLTIQTARTGSAFVLNAGANLPTSTTSLEVSLYGMTIDGEAVFRDEALIYGVDDLGPLSLTLDSLYVKNYRGTQGAVGFIAGNSPGDSTLTVDDSIFTNNVSTEVTGGAISSSGAITVNSSTFTSNGSAFSGGAILGYGVINVNDSSFSDNFSEGGGAIASLSGSNVNVSSSTFLENSSADVGGAVASSGWVTSTNSTYVDNSTFGTGGAIFSEGASLISNTFVNNVNLSEGGSGSALYTLSGAEIYGNLFVSDSDATMCEFDGSYSPVVIDAGANLGTASCGTQSDSPWPNWISGTNNASAVVLKSQLKLGVLALNKTSPTNSGTTKTISIGASSVARDYRSNTVTEMINPFTAALLVDQRGVSRPKGARSDVGAYEYAAESAVITCTAASLGKIKFLANSAKLTKAAKKALRKKASSIAATNCRTVVLEGYTAKISNNPGSKKVRLTLSQRRTSSTMKYLKKELAKKGVKATFVVSNLGGANPAASNKSEAGKAKNRRVEINIRSFLS